MFRCSQQVIKKFYKKNHNLLPGIISVVHSNGSDLKYHPHIHMIVSAGGIDIDTNELKELSSNYLCSQRYIADQFKTLLMKELKKLLLKKKIKISYSKGRKNLLSRIEACDSGQWIVNIDKPLDGVEKIIAYVGRYTKKSCISERRILSIDNNKITISFKDYKNSERGEKPKEGKTTMSSTAFLDRLLQHVPEKRFNVVRYYGLYAHQNINKVPEESKITELKIAEIDYSEIEDLEGVMSHFKKYRELVREQTGKDPVFCYACNQSMKLMEIHYQINGETKVYDLYNSS